MFTKVDVNRVNIGQQIRSMPTFQFWLNGKKMEEFSGGDEGSLRRVSAAIWKQSPSCQWPHPAESGPTSVWVVNTHLALCGPDRILPQ